ncbi:hypothetical protein FGIG_00248 [Fasciola gigantica]|uniref:Reverse transcriptase domain-containing protein n=1 Tax=Fasciola gigantica TaxID=46835 RepID=A0A504ZE64_FASGI|nr:hypothetical protein FGIG_00248 [Fasciola gigantica]
MVFLQRTGCSEILNALHAILLSVHQVHFPLVSVFADVSSAFSSVCHDTFLTVARTAGLPDSLVEYLQNPCGSAAVQPDEDLVTRWCCVR